MTNQADRNAELNPASQARWETIKVHKDEAVITITFDRLNRENAFNSAMLREIQQAVDLAESDAGCRMVVLRGQNGFFCNGLDIEEGISQNSSSPDSPEPYVDLLRRLNLIARVVVSVVDGQAAAGGLGFVAASDVVLATSRSRFSLPEAIFGLVPACVGLYLARRIGFQTALQMSLNLQTLTAEAARSCGLVDEVTETPDASLNRLALRASRLQTRTIGSIKRFFREIGQVDEAREQRAIAETSRLMHDDSVREAIANFVHHKRFPWE